MLTSNRSGIQKILFVVFIIHTINVFYVGAETTTFSLATIDNNSILITSVAVGVLVPVLIIVVILMAFVTLVLLIRNGNIQ